MKATSPKELALFDAMVAAMSGCPKCSWDEAEGGLVNHCASCCYKTTCAAWAFAAEATRTKPALDTPPPKKRRGVPKRGEVPGKGSA